MMRVNCPECDTSFLFERLGIPLEEGVRATVQCPVCKDDFDLQIFGPQKRIMGIPMTRKQVRVLHRKSV